MTYDFDTIVRRGPGSLKQSWTPEKIAAAGYVSFDAAEMDFSTAPSVIRSIHELADGGYFGFNQITEEYRGRVRWWMAHVRQWEIENEWIVPVMGTIFSVATAIRMTTEPGEAILVPDPGYNRYAQAARRLGRETRTVRLAEENGEYRLDREALERAMADPKVKLMVLCNPHNPTARVWTLDELNFIAELSAQYQKVVFSDEIFAEITFDGRRTIPYADIAKGREFALVCTSLGKAFSYTGVNHANMIIPDERLRERFMKQRYADHYGSLEPFAYASVMGAYCEEGLDWMRQMLLVVGENRRMAQEFFALPDSPGYLYPVEGTYVCWIRWKDAFGKGEELKRFLVDEAFLALEAGTDFGDEYPEYTRMNLAGTNRQTRLALERLGKACQKRRKGGKTDGIAEVRG